MTTLSSASQASTYYSKDNYYTKETTAESLENASWYGKGASVLNLDEKDFDPDRFKELLHGEIDENKTISRTTKDENGVAVSQHRPGVDLTFSAPKSVSIMAEVFKNDDVRNAHEDAVKATLDHVEKMYAQTRISVDGSMQKVNTENLIVALFSHNNSRELDPQTHTHAVVMNATLNQKGEWSALSNEQIYQSQKLIGAIYNSELANNLNELGFDLEFKANGNFEIAGIGQDAIDAFSQRRQAMIKSAEERGIDLSSASASMREQVALKTRTSKKDVTQESLDKDWSERAEALGLTPKLITEINDKAADNRKQIEKNSITEKSAKKGKSVGGEDRSMGRSTFVPKADKELSTGSDSSRGSNSKGGEKSELQIENTSPGGNVAQGGGEKSKWQNWLDRVWGYFDKEKQTSVKAQVKSGANKQQINEALSPKEKLVREAVYYAVGHHTEREMMVKRDDIESLALNYAGVGARINDVAGEVDRLLGEGILVVGGSGRVTTQRMAKSEVWSINHVKEERNSVDKILGKEEIQADLKDREAIQKFAYTEGQRNAIESIFTTASRYHAVNGLAGTGKTTMLLGLNKIAEKHGYIVKGMAGTGVAAKNLEEETGIPSSTIAMFKLNEQKLQNEIHASGDSVNRKNEIWVVDESSFASQESFAEILKLSKSADSRIVFLGDKLQLQSIEAGKPFEILQEHMSKSSMEDINRQKTQELKDVVSLITAKNPKGEITLSENQNAFDLLDKQGSIIEHEQSELHEALVADYMSNSLEQRNNSLIITPFNSDRSIINNLVREKKKSKDELQGDELQFLTFVNKNLTKAQQGNHKEYATGNVIRFNKTYTPEEGTKFVKDEYYTVVGSYNQRDGKKENGLILQDANGNKQKWASKNKNMVEVYEQENKDLMKGDLIKINRTNGDFKNGEKYTFKEKRDGEIVLQDEKGNEKTMSEKDFKHWDHGYANTIYSSQGLTKSSIFMLINSEKLSNAQNDEKAIKNLGKIFGNRAFYVGVTRASKELKIFTHDKNVARGAVGYEQDKTSYSQESAGFAKEDKGLTQNKGFGMEIE